MVGRNWSRRGSTTFSFILALGLANCDKDAKEMRPLGRNKSIHAVDMHLDQHPSHLADVPSNYDCTSQSASPMLWSRAMHLPQDVLDRLLDAHRDDLDGAARSLRKHQLGQLIPGVGAQHVPAQHRRWCRETVPWRVAAQHAL